MPGQLTKRALLAVCERSQHNKAGALSNSGGRTLAAVGVSLSQVPSMELYRAAVAGGVDTIAAAVEGGNSFAICELDKLRTAPSSEPARFSRS